MDRRSRSPDSPGRRHRRRRRNSRSYSRSRSRDRSRERRRRYSRSMSRERIYRRIGGGGGGSNSPDLYKDIVETDYQNEREKYNRHDRNDRKGRDKDRYYHRGRGHSSESSNDSFNGEQVNKEHFRNQTPSNKVIILGLAQHITEADINNDLIHYAIQPVSIRLIRKRKTGASRGFAFVEFNTEEEATRWMEYKQGVLMFQDQYRAIMQYSVSKESINRDRVVTDWYCAKCGVFNFKRRENCFKCNASREESEKGGEGSDEVSFILTKKIMLRNLDILTNEEGVLTAIQNLIPDFVSKISKILICRDPLTSTSRGICYLSFDNLVDSMNTYNSLKALEPKLKIDNREIIVTYCIDVENRQINRGGGRNHHDSNHKGNTLAGHQYTLADVPRLAEYSASVYAQTPSEHDYYHKYYMDYYKEQISKGMFANLPTMSQLGQTANSGAAVALSAIQRKLKKNFTQSTAETATTAAVTSPAVVQAAPVQVPNGTDNKKYPTPDLSLYQYDESSGYYYDPMTGLYYDSNSQYYYNSEIGQYLYWDQEKSTYVVAAVQQTAASAATTTSVPAVESPPTYAAQPTTVENPADSLAASNNGQSDDKKDGRKGEQKHDRVKVAKKIVKDMEKWAKQLNQKKDMMQAVPPPPQENEPIVVPKPQPVQRNMTGYADVGFSILENKERGKTTLELAASSSAGTTNKLVSTYTSDSDNEQAEQQQQQSISELNERDYVDFEKLTCLLCKRAFQSSDILNKHLKMSNLHKENLQKLNLKRFDDKNNGNEGGYGPNSALSYRDRAKERRLKYGETDLPPPNKSRERFEKEMQRHTVQLQKQASSNLASTPIGVNNVGNRLLQKMGWSEGQGLGRSNQGRTNIIEAESRASSAGLGTKTTNFAPGDDYKSYIKRMMKTRYEQA